MSDLAYNWTRFASNGTNLELFKIIFLFFLARWIKINTVKQKTYLESQICPNWCQSGQIGGQIRHPWFKRQLIVYYSIDNLLPRFPSIVENVLTISFAISQLIFIILWKLGINQFSLNCFHQIAHVVVGGIVDLFNMV